MRRQLLFALAPLPLALAMGCGTTVPTCKDTATLYDLGQAAPGGQTGTAIAQHAIGVHPVRLSLIQTPSEPIRITPAIPDNTEGTLTISVIPGAQWSHVISEYVACSSNINCADKAVSCSDYFTVPIQARLTAFNGTIDETWNGELVANDMNDPEVQATMLPDGSAANLSVKRDANSFLGNLKIATRPLHSNETLTGHEVVLEAAFKEGKLLKAQLSDESDTETSGPHPSVNRYWGNLITIAPAS